MPLSFLPEVLGGEDAGTGYAAEQAEIIDEEKLVDDGDAGHLLGANLTDHDIV